MSSKYYVRRNDNVLIRFNPVRYIPAWDVMNCFQRSVGTYENENDAIRQAELANRMLDRLATQQHKPDDIQTLQRRIGSISWLHNVNGIALTPCFDGNGHALRIDITYEEFEAVKHDSDAMKQLAAIKILERKQKSGTI